MDEATIKNPRLAATKAGMQSPHKYPLVHCHAIITWCARKIKPKPEVGANHAKKTEVRPVPAQKSKSTSPGQEGHRKMNLR